MKKGYLRNVSNKSYLGEAFSPLEPDPSIEKFNKRSKSKTGQWKSNPAARAIVINLEHGGEEFSQSIPSYEIEEATEGLEPIKAKDGLVIYRAETYVVVVMGNR